MKKTKQKAVLPYSEALAKFQKEREESMKKATGEMALFPWIRVEHETGDFVRLADGKNFGKTIEAIISEVFGGRIMWTPNTRDSAVKYWCKSYNGRPPMMNPDLEEKFMEELRDKGAGDCEECVLKDFDKICMQYNIKNKQKPACQKHIHVGIVIPTKDKKFKPYVVDTAVHGANNIADYVIMAGYDDRDISDTTVVISSEQKISKDKKFKWYVPTFTIGQVLPDSMKEEMKKMQYELHGRFIKTISYNAEELEKKEEKTDPKA